MRWRVICASSERDTPSIAKVNETCSIGLSWPISDSILTKLAVFSSVSPSSTLSTSVEE